MHFTHTLADQIDALLPQTQCRQCGYNGCRPYAEAIATGNAEINQCPPGGILGIERLAKLLERKSIPLNPAHGIEKPKSTALIDEEICIGCTKCIQACPVDAIIGAAKLMHTVLVDECTGCEMCIPPCPVDCITMIPVSQQYNLERADFFRRRYLARQARLVREESEHITQIAAQKTQIKKTDVSKQTVLEAIARAKAKKTNTPN